MAEKSTRKLVVNIEAQTKNFNLNIEKAAANQKKFREETKQTYGFQQRLANAFQQSATAAAVLQGPLDQVSGRLSSMSTQLRNTNAALVIFGGTLTGLGLIAAKAFREVYKAEEQFARIGAVLEATGHAAGFTAAELDDFSRSVALNTLASVDGVRDAVAVLGTFRSVTGNTFKEAIMLSQDMADVMGTSLTSAVTMMGKALEDPVNGINSMNRAGVTFTATQKELIKDLLDAGKIYEAQGVVLENVKSQLEGIAEAVAANTAAGSWDTFTQHIERAFEVIGQKLKLLEGFKSGLNAINEFIDRTTIRANIQSATMDETIRQLSRVQKQMYAIEKGGVAGDKERERYQKLYDERKKILDRQAELVKEYNDKEGEAHKARQAAAEEAAAQEKTRLEAALAEQEKVYVRASARIQRMIEQQTRALATARTESFLNVDKADADYETLIKKIDEKQAQEREQFKNHTSILLKLEAEYFDLRAIAFENYQAQREAAMLADEKRMEEYYNKNLELREKNEDFDRAGRLKEINKESQTWTAYATAVGSAMDAVSMHLAQGSKAYQTFVVLQKTTAAASAIIATYAAATKAMETSLSNPERMLAYAQTIAAGMAAVSAISSVAVGARATGGPVSAGGSYWVGENGPEVVTMGSDGYVTSNKQLTPNVNVNIIEDASRAGQVEQSGDIVSVFVAAAMTQLNEDFNSGRGLFQAMEHKYGLRR